MEVLQPGQSRGHRTLRHEAPAIDWWERGAPKERGKHLRYFAAIRLPAEHAVVTIYTRGPPVSRRAQFTSTASWIRRKPVTATGLLDNGPRFLDTK